MWFVGNLHPNYGLKCRLQALVQSNISASLEAGRRDVNLRRLFMTFTGHRN